MTLEEAERLILIASKKAEKAGTPISIAVTDENGFLVAIHRMDGAPPPTAEMARDKAWTASSFRVPTEEAERFGTPNTSNLNDRFTSTPGGLPVFLEGRLIGALGISGAGPEEDKRICKETIEEFAGGDG